MKTSNKKTIQRIRRHKRIRAKIAGTALKPRLSIFKSNRYMYAELIDDDKGNTVAAASSAKAKTGTKLAQSKAVGVEVAKKAKELKIETVVFDRGGFTYTGRVKAVAEGAREGGLKF